MPPPKRAGSCFTHVSTEVANSKVLKISAKKYKRKVVEYLINEVLLQSYPT